MASEPAPFSIDSERRDGRVVLVVRGELDIATAPTLDEAMRVPLAAGEDVVLDLRELEFMDSSGVRTLVTAHGQATQGGGSFSIVRPLPDSPVAKVLAIAGIESQLNLLTEL